MSRAKLSLILVIIFIFFNPIGIFASDYVINDFTFYSIPAVPRPPKGEPYIDSVFKTSITRITDAKTEAPATYFYVSGGYAKHNIENADGTKLAVKTGKYPNWAVWNALPPYGKIRDIPVSITSDKDPDVRWDNEDPSILYSTYGNHLYKYNVVTNAITLLHDFKVDFPTEPIARVYTAEEGDASADRRYWAFIVRCYDPNLPVDKAWYITALTVYDKDFYGKDNGKVISKLAKNDPKFYGANFSSMSPSGEYIHIGAPPSYIYPRDFSSVRTIKTHGHVALAVDKLGREVLVDSVQGENVGTGFKGGWARLSDIQTGEQWLLAPIAADAAGCHFGFSAHDKGGWAVYSDYHPVYPGVPSLWNHQSVMMVELIRKPNLKLPYPTIPTNHARVWRVAHTHVVRKDYADDPFAKFNKKGTKIYFNSGWGASILNGQVDVYQINLPSTWYQDLMGNLPPTVSISATPLSGKPPLTVNFTGSGKDIDGTIASYTWNFGDGGTSSQQSVSHTYESSGSYTATFKVTDDKGATGNANVTINVLKSDTTPPATPTGLKIVK